MSLPEYFTLFWKVWQAPLREAFILKNLFLLTFVNKDFTPPLIIDLSVSESECYKKLIVLTPLTTTASTDTEEEQKFNAKARTMGFMLNFVLYLLFIELNLQIKWISSEQYIPSLYDV